MGIVTADRSSSKKVEGEARLKLFFNALGWGNS